MVASKIFVLALTLLSMLTTGGDAAERVNVAMMSGKCDALIASNRDLSHACGGKILNSSHSNGRVGFYFFISDKAILTLSGKDLPNPSANTDEIRVDMILFNLGIEGVPPSETRAFGKCLYENPFQGVPAKVICNGTMEDGSQFKTRFVTDGNEPTMLTDVELASLPPAAIDALKPNLPHDPKMEGQR